MTQVSDIEILAALKKEFDLVSAKQYCERIASVRGPLAAQYQRVAKMINVASTRSQSPEFDRINHGPFEHPVSEEDDENEINNLVTRGIWKL